LFHSFIAPNSSPQFYICMNGRKIKCLLDTGASVSFIRSNVALDNNAQQLHGAMPHIHIGDGRTIEPKSLCMANFSISNKHFSHSFYALTNCPFEIIIGLDFILEHKVVIDLPNGQFFFSPHSQKRMNFQNKEFISALVMGLNTKQQTELDSLLSQYPDVMSDKIGCTNWTDFKLEVDSEPIAQKPYKVSQFKRDIISQKLKEMLQLGICRPSTSEWASPVSIRKQDNDYRFCLDYRKLNRATKSDPYPIPRIEDLISRLGEARFISKIDLRKGYWQVKMHPDSIKYTAFICHDGKYEFTRMPFGPKTAPSVFQRLVNRLLGKARGRFADAYLDDIIIFSNSWNEHLEHLEFILGQLRKANLTANVKKCSFGDTKMKYLGFLITPDGVSTDPEKLDPVKNFPVPRNPKQVKQFLGLCGWYRHFIPHFSTISEPLTCLLRHDTKFLWSDKQQLAFETLKNNIVNACTLIFPDFTKPFTLRTDASDAGLGAVLSQMSTDGNELPIAFASRSLTDTERPYHATEKECLAIVWALKKFEQYLDGQTFNLETDNRALTWLHSMKDVNSKFMRWALKIQDFQPNIKHLPGRINVVADALSRAPTGSPEEETDKDYMYPPTAPNCLALLSSLTPDLNISDIASEQNKDNEVQALVTKLPPNFVLHENILYKSHNGLRLPYIPKSLRHVVLQYFHDAPHSGHFGARKTIRRIVKRVFWFGMQEDIYTYIRSCHTCQSHKNPNSKPSGQLQSVIKNGPWDMLAIDLMGPLPATASRKTQLLVIVDHFSKWVELFALKDGKADQVRKVLESQIFCRWGAPSSLLSDNATNFRGKAFRDMCKGWGIKHKFTSSYHPQGNITERVNRNIRTMLASYITTRHNKWDEHLAELGLALRTCISDTTGFSPAFLNLGREIRLPFDRVIESTSDSFISRSEYKTELIKRLDHALECAKRSFQKSHTEQKKYYDRRHKAVIFQLNDKVLLRTHYLSNANKKFARKLAPRWIGPYIVSEIVSPVSYKLRALDSDNEIGTHNIKNLKPYFDRPNIHDSFVNDDEHSKNTTIDNSNGDADEFTDNLVTTKYYNLRKRN